MLRQRFFQAYIHGAVHSTQAVRRREHRLEAGVDVLEVVRVNAPEDRECLDLRPYAAGLDYSV